jgi:hypothetical protein
MPICRAHTFVTVMLGRKPLYSSSAFTYTSTRARFWNGAHGVPTIRSSRTHPPCSLRHWSSVCGETGGAATGS